jgi:predicted O-linked N-acetylglucosamine transferase (SPINDLY family)/glycosyltransferase involved in cell wall biosynthesis
MKIAIFDTQHSYNVTTPYNSPLGGTQSAICYFIETMRTKGHVVYLFNNIKETNNNYHIPYHKYTTYIKEHSLTFDLVIVSCIGKDIINIKNSLNNICTLYCLWTGHDIDQPIMDVCNNMMIKDMIDLFIFVSSWQRDRYIDKFNIDYTKTIVMKNGIGKSFEKFLDLPTNKINNSMSYCSIPWRGLKLLEPIFNNIGKDVNNATLKIFSGMNIYNIEETNEYNKFRNMDNVTYNYGIGQEQLANELYKIDFLTYPNIFPETSCITILQAMACGCLIISSNLGALKETIGHSYDLIDINLREFNTGEYIDNFVLKLKSRMMLHDDVKEVLRENNRQHIKNNHTWDVICTKFEKDISIIMTKYNMYIQNYKNIIDDYLKTFIKNNWTESINNYNKIIYYPRVNEYYAIKLNYGVCCYNLEQLDKAKDIFKMCKDMNNDFNINKNLAMIELKQNNNTKFFHYGYEALNCTFECIVANLMADKMEQECYYHEAIGLYESILKIDKNNINCLNNLGNLQLLMLPITKNKTDTYIKGLKIALNNKEHRKADLLVSNIIFNNLYDSLLNDIDIYNKTIEYVKYISKPSLCNKSQQNYKSKIHIGYISTDFSTHPVGFMFESIIKNHDTSKYNIFCYDNSSDKSTDLTAIKLRNYKNAMWYNINTMSDKEVLDIMERDNLDILVDMMGHTRNNRINLMQYKMAPIQISYFAYPLTTGIQEIDYKLTDKYANPEGTQKYFTEKLYYLPNGFQCYTPPMEIDGTKNYNRDPQYPIHLGCFNNPIKFSEQTIDTFVKILLLLPESKLFLRYCYYKSSFYKEGIISLFTNKGISRERIDINVEPLILSLQQYNNIDIALDPFPYNGGTISSEALYMNTPFITLAGTNYISRVGVSLLSCMGMEKYIANNTYEYISKVVELARNKEELHNLHNTIRKKMLETDLANSKSFTKHLEEAYDNMIHTLQN